MDNKLTLKDLKKVSFEMLCWLDSFCKNNGLRYVLDGGTLLGAVRHHGFIPWDDDIDVTMPRKDYDKLCNLLSKKPDPRYHLYAAETDRNYLYPFGKLIDTKTIAVEKHIDCGVELGVWIDIIPIDEDTGDHSKQERRLKEYMNKSSALGFAMARKHEGTGLRKAIGFLLDGVVKISGRRLYTDRLLRFGKKYNGTNSGWLNTCVYFYQPKKVISADFYDHLIEEEFEGKMFFIPSSYDKHLTDLYGDYMQLPPENQRKPHHDFDAYWR